MPTTLNPYLGFRDTARHAMEFYRDVFGGELTISTFGEMQMGDPGDEDKVMHSMLTTAKGMVLMGSDTPAATEYIPGTNFSVSISGDDEAELRGYWDGLTEGGRIDVPLEVAPWGDIFGMVTDRFGVDWMIGISGASD
ncbi:MULTISPECIES: VOC family protein [Rhodococcus]|uniref:Glyoxalase family protein n=1 Tax=Rhodococcus coprophilus TaxID=38310 RepID=A0A2X4WNQ5_9NOCA|nr:VOC family protein [Rhodococcus coprophilus]SQI28555.1 glyoxalase family protein [Rhodococcus coprophilus]